MIPIIENRTVTHCDNCPFSRYECDQIAESFHCFYDPDNPKYHAIQAYSDDETGAIDMPLPESCPLRGRKVIIELTTAG